MNPDIIIIGAGAAGLMCAIEAGKRGRNVLILEHNAEVGEKIRISGGGRCNFTNRTVNSSNYISQNPHFCKSALARYTPADFIALIEKHDIPFHERDHGQLFCDNSAEQIIRMLLEECRLAKVKIQTSTEIKKIRKLEDGFDIITGHSSLTTPHLVIATGGLSIPKLGASNFGFQIAKQFSINIIPPKPGLVPLKFDSKDFEVFRDLSGISIDAKVTCHGISFRENILLTHRGFSGPAILQVSSYWNEGDSISINLLPGIDVPDILTKELQSKKHLATILDQLLPSRFVKVWLEQRDGSKPMNQYTPAETGRIAEDLTHWHLTPTGTEEYAKAEVTVGGIDTKELSSKTMEATKVPGLYFIGEVVDVTGWLGGFNFQWAWSSGWAAGQAL